MYSERVMKKLRAAGVKIWDKVDILTKSGEYRGIVMPRIELGDLDCLVIKLDNGYNIGVHVDEIKKIQKIKTKEGVVEIKKEIRGEIKEEIRKEEKGEKEETRKTREEREKEIVILGCGGTIASRVEYKTGAVYPSLTSEDLLLSFPMLETRRENLRVKNIFQIFSEDMTPNHWKIIAEEVAKEIKSDKISGIVLMHGTDTMHYTSAALSFMLRSPVPVVLVGAQRSSDRGSSDNLMNLMSAILLSESDIAEIGICMHGTINDDFCYFHRGTKVRKLHTSRRDAFKTVNGKPIAKIWWKNEKIEIISPYRKRGEMKLALDTKINPNVGLIYIHPGIKQKFVEKFAEFYDGVVLAGTGLGHVPTGLDSDSSSSSSLLPAIKSLIERGIPVVMAPQTIFGRINMNVYASGRKLLEMGVIGNYCDWTPECALVKLMWVLGHTKNMKKIEEMMLTNIAGEISERSEIV